MTPDPQRAGRNWSSPAVIVVAVLVCYANSFPSLFVFDDFSSIVENPSIRTLAPATALTPPPTAGVGGRPIANLSFALSHAISGLNPAGFHALNLALHLAAALTLFGVVRRALGSTCFNAHIVAAARSLATAVALMWAIHPLGTAVVNYNSQRTEALMTFCYLFTIYCATRLAETPLTRWRILGITACAAGMLSKEVMVTAPLVTLFYDRVFLAGSWRDVLRARAAFYFGLASTWLLLAVVLTGSHLADRGVGFGQGVSWTSYAMTQIHAVGNYLRLTLVPAPLVFDYGWSFGNETADRVAGLFTLLAAVVTVIVIARRAIALSFVCGAVLLILAPTSSVVPIVQQPVAESRMYLPLAPILAAVCVAGFAFLRGGRRPCLPVPIPAGRDACRHAHACARTVFIFALIGCAALTWSRNVDYCSEVTLWTDTVSKRPSNARAHSNLAAALLRAGENTRALAAAETAVRLKPDYAEAHHNLGLALARSGRVAEAVAQYELALGLGSAPPDTLYNLAELLLLSGRNDAAILLLERTVRLNPRHARAHNNLSVARLNQDMAANAATSARTALALDPNFAAAHYNLGNALARLGDRTGAIASFEAAVRLDPGFARAHNNLGALLLQTGSRAAAKRHFETALKLDPNHASARQNLERLEASER